MSEPFEQLLASSIAPCAGAMDNDTGTLRSCINLLVTFLRTSNAEGICELTNSDLELIFGTSGCLGLVIWQHFAALERLEHSGEISDTVADVIAKLRTGEELCGLATTHLAAPAGSPVRVTFTAGSYFLTGTINWVTGYRIFQHLLIGFECGDEVLYALTPFEVEGHGTSFSVKPMELAVMNASSTVRLHLADFRVDGSTIIMKREKRTPPPYRSKYLIPELGIGKRLLTTIDLSIAKTHPKVDSIRKALARLRVRLRKIEKLRENPSPDAVEVTRLRDRFNLDALRLHVLAEGASALEFKSPAPRISRELMLMDVVLQPAGALLGKIDEIP